MNEECVNCPHRGQCDMQCYNEYNVYYCSEDYQDVLDELERGYRGPEE